MKLLILDGNSVINRAYFGVKPLTTRDGLYTNAIYGVRGFRPPRPHLPALKIRGL